MATVKGKGRAAGPPQDDELINELKEKLYEQCCLWDPQDHFNQEHLLNTGIIPNRDIMLLVQVAQRLVDEKLFKLVRDTSSTSSATWMYRSREDAAKYATLTSEQEMVYGWIDDSGSEGIWSKTLKTRLNMHESTMRAALKQLESKRYITDMKSVEHLNRKMYIKASLTPSEKATGGPWYTDGELDEEFIVAITNVLYNKIFDRSFQKTSRKGVSRHPAKKAKSSDGNAVGRPSAKDAKALRDAALKESNVQVKLEVDDNPFAKKKPNFDVLLPMPAGYTGYPTLDELTLFVENLGVTQTTLTRDDVQTLLDVLCFDHRIEKVISGPEGFAYKARRQTNMELENGPMNGLTESPCGRCPVFDLCEEGGPVAPSNCVYFKTWLGWPEDE